MMNTGSGRGLLALAAQAAAAFLIGALAAGIFCTWLWTAAWM